MRRVPQTPTIIATSFADPAAEARSNAARIYRSKPAIFAIHTSQLFQNQHFQEFYTFLHLTH
jgi:hypothetical protein